MSRGVVFAALAYAIWGLFPIYVKSLRPTPPGEILAYRMVGTLGFALLVLGLMRNWDWVRALRREPRKIRLFAASAAMITLNWGIFIWAVNTGHVVDSSLGYFINPLTNVLLGWAVFQERLRRWQWTAVGIAAAGVAWLAWQSGGIPYIGLGLAISFSAYGLLRKIAPLGSLQGLALETALLAPAAMLYLGWLALRGENTFLNSDASMQLLLLSSGPATAIPLLLFAAGARRIPFLQLGLLQYIGPSLQLMIGIWVYHEPFRAVQMIGFGMIWLGLGVYLLETALQPSGQGKSTTPT
ncbi:MAG: EamA family transporter RarD [Verrucomicrobia bacterium]|nr:EamA family transporter RarD [Verrucomicrobiota bacterium]